MTDQVFPPLPSLAFDGVCNLYSSRQLGIPPGGEWSHSVEIPESDFDPRIISLTFKAADTCINSQRATTCNVWLP